MDLRAAALGRHDPAPDAGAESSSRSGRAALVAFAVAVAVAVPVLLWFGREQWFFFDEFEFLARRDLEDPAGLLEPHNEHWTTLPIVLYRAIYQVVGARHYWPYLVPVIGAHLVTACLLRSVIRRAGVDPWIATTACVAFVFLGSGREGIVWGFQITFTGALALGLVALLLTDRTGPVGRHDVAAVACSIAALATSGIGVAMVAAIGVACLARRDLPRAALHVGVPALTYVAWYVAFGSDATSTLRPTLGDAGRFVGWTGVAALEGLAGTPVGAVLLGAAAIGGTVAAVVALARPGSGAVRRAQANLIGLAAAATLLLVTTAWARAAAFPVGRLTVPGRYVHVVVAMLLPAIARGLDAAARRCAPRHVGVVGACALLLVGVPSNVRSLRAEGADRYSLGFPEGVRTLAAVAVDRHTPPHVVARNPWAPGVSAGWLARALESGDLAPPPEPLDPRLAAQSALALSLERVPGHPSHGCTPLDAPVDLAAGDVLWTDATAMTVVEPSPVGFVEVTFSTADLLPGAALGDGDTEDGIAVRVVDALRLRNAHGPRPADVVHHCRAG